MHHRRQTAKKNLQNFVEKIVYESENQTDCFMKSFQIGKVKILYHNFDGIEVCYEFTASDNRRFFPENLSNNCSRKSPAILRKNTNILHDFFNGFFRGSIEFFMCFNAELLRTISFTNKFCTMNIRVN